MSAANQNSGSDLFRFKRVPERDLCFFFLGVSGITELGVVDRWISRWNSLLGTSTIAAGDPK